MDLKKCCDCGTIEYILNGAFIYEYVGGFALVLVRIKVKLNKVQYLKELKLVWEVSCLSHIHNKVVLYIKNIRKIECKHFKKISYIGVRNFNKFHVYIWIKNNICL